MAPPLPEIAAAPTVEYILIRDHEGTWVSVWMGGEFVERYFVHADSVQAILPTTLPAGAKVYA